MSALLVFIIFCGAGVQAQEPPVELVSKLAARSRAEGSVLPFLDYIDWETTFNSFTDQEKKDIARTNGVNSPQGLKEHTARVLRDPVGYTAQQIERSLTLMPAENRPPLASKKGEILATTQRIVEEERLRLSRADFKTRSVDSSSDKAAVELTTIIDGQESKQQLSLVKKHNQWLLLQLPALAAPQAPPDSSAQKAGTIKRD